jgi:hypothetical protein
MKKQQGHALMIIFIVAAVLILLAALGYLFWQSMSKSTKSADTAQSNASTTTSDPQVTMTKYCATGEKLCFDYPSSWTVVKDAEESGSHDTGYTGDDLTVKSDTGLAPLALHSGIGGIGGTCDPESETKVYALNSVAIPKMTGFKSDYSLDMLHAAHVIVQDFETGRYIAAVYATGDQAYTVKQEIMRCGIGFSGIMYGRNAKFSSDSENAGAFEFGYVGQNSDVRYDTVEAATKAYDTDAYKQATTILASLRYE